MQNVASAFYVDAKAKKDILASVASLLDVKQSTVLDMLQFLGLRVNIECRSHVLHGVG
jgi:hypothetical protein